MNKANLKSYAPQARKDFIAAVTARANQLGLSVKAGSLEVALAQTQGDVTVIAGQAWPSKVNGQRDKADRKHPQKTALNTPWKQWLTPGSTALQLCASWNCTTTWVMATERCPVLQEDYQTS
jgi:hypothetical protein